LKVADRLGWEDTGPAEYVAVASLQSDALVTEDAERARAAEGLVRVASFGELSGLA
jgi:hypothetical protein